MMSHPYTLSVNRQTQMFFPPPFSQKVNSAVSGYQFSNTQITGWRQKDKGRKEKTLSDKRSRWERRRERRTCSEIIVSSTGELP